MSIKKIAFFVEGYTEQEFLKNLLSEVFNQNEIDIEIKEAKGGSKVKISYTTIQSSIPSPERKYFALIFNCGGDSAIKSFIMDRRESLIASGYYKIIGLRDLYPDFTKADSEKLIKGLLYKTPQAGISIKFLLSVMEVESWFLAEENHYASIDIGLLIEEFKDKFDFDPSVDNTEEINEAAEKLKIIYNSVGKTYKKETRYIDRTINALDYDNLYLNVVERNNSLKELANELNEFIESK